jgi:iron(III) transport system ATP-binding protein
VIHTALGDLIGMQEYPLPSAYADGRCDVLRTADDIVRRRRAPIKAQILRKRHFAAQVHLRLQTGEVIMAHVPSHHDHALVVDRDPRRVGR